MRSRGTVGSSWLGLRVIVVVAVLAPLATAAGPARSSEPARYSEEFITSGDGTRLWTQVWRPPGVDDDEATPVVLNVTPDADAGVVVGDWHGLLDGVMARGWTLVQVSLRGYAASEGCGDLFGPDEQMDALAAAEWADGQPWSTGRVGMHGISYGAVTQLMALSNDAPIDAAVMASPVLSLYDGLIHDGVHYQGWREVPDNYTRRQVTSGPTPQVPTCMAETFIHDRTDTERDTPFFSERDFIPGARGTDVPVLWTRGFWEDLGSHNLLPVWSTLKGDARGTFGHSQHSWAARNDQLELELDFLAQHIDGALAPKGPKVRVQDNEGYWRGEESWPPADAVAHTISLNGGTYRDILGADYVDYADDAIWTFTQPVEGTVRLSGRSLVTMTVDYPVDVPALPSSHDDPRVIVTVYDVEPDGTATLVTRGASLLRGTGEARVDLHEKEWVIRRGHRLGIAISGAEDSSYEGGTTGLPSTVSGAKLSMSLLKYTRDGFLDGGTPSGVVLPRPTTIPDALIASHTADASLPPAVPCGAAPGGCGAFASDGQAPRAADKEVLLDYVEENLQPDYKCCVTIGNGPRGYAFFEVPESKNPLTVTIIADPDRLANIDIRVQDENLAFRGGSFFLDLRREGAVLPALPPGRYRLFVRQAAGNYELAPIGLPTNVHVRVTLHRGERNLAPVAELAVDPEVVSGTGPIDIAATIEDFDGIKDIVEANLAVTDAHGRTIAISTLDDFAETSPITLGLQLEELRLQGPSPWTVELRVVDSVGHSVTESRVIRRE